MPELPEVETTLRGIKSHILKQKITAVVIYYPHLRFPIPPDLNAKIRGLVIENVTRRGKYLLFKLSSRPLTKNKKLIQQKTLILHLGMSGSLRLHQKGLTLQKHDHLDIHFANGTFLRYTDPRRFGSLLFTEDEPEKHPLIVNIGIEPLTRVFNGDYLWERALNRKVAVKSFLMNSKIVAGIGNIYATEALFQAKIHPKKPAGKISRDKYDALAIAIKAVLKQAIKRGGTTLKNFTSPEGRPGYFHLQLQVYGREGQPCPHCKTTLRSLTINARSTVFCPMCQRM